MILIVEIKNYGHFENVTIGVCVYVIESTWGLLTGDNVSSAAAIKDGANVLLIFLSFTSCLIFTALFSFTFFHDFMFYL